LCLEKKNRFNDSTKRPTKDQRAVVAQVVDLDLQADVLCLKSRIAGSPTGAESAAGKLVAG
jgi:hypothetical protein